MKEQRRLELKVGAFVVLLLAAATGVVLLLGSKQHVFERRVTLHTTFDDVAGLREGAPVWLSGVGVGSVTRIRFVRAQSGKEQVVVDLEIASRDLERVHADSVARIGSQGLLGDKIISLSVGSAQGPQIQPDGDLLAEQPVDYDKLVAQASDVLKKTQSVADDAAIAMHTIADPKVLADARGIVASVHKLLHTTVEGRGLAHALFYDQRTAEDLQSMAGSLSRLSAHVDTGVQHIDKILGATDGDGRQLINQLARAAKNVGDAAGQLKDSRIVPHLDRASADLAELTGTIKNGGGTIGALIQDPTVYEQLVTVLGGVARSRILRALVRYAIKKDEGKSAGRVVDEPQAPPLKTQQRAATKRTTQ